VAFRCNLVTLASRDGHTIMDDYSAGHIPTRDAVQIITALKSALDDASFTLHPGVSYRHLLVWKNGSNGMRTTPPHDITGKPVDEFLPQGAGADTIRLLMERSRSVLAELELNRERARRGHKPVSTLWLWGQGTSLTLPTFKEKYNLRGSVISAVDLVKGLGICAGLSPITVPGATGYLDTNYAGKAAAALDALAVVDFVYLHVEAPDEASHNGSLPDKIQAIEDFDRKVVRPVVEGLAQRFADYRILLMPDHATPLATRTHATDPVPFVICSAADMRRDSARDIGYNESDAAASGLYIAEGWTLMDLLLKG
jgi:2,3-bisphosphoglycerate-independent phosphoglycerate mutase